MNKLLKKYGSLISGILMVATCLTACYEEPDGSQLFDADEMTLNQLIQQDADLSAFHAILQKCGYDKKISTYQKYVCFAPVNDGVSIYLDSLYNDVNIRCPHNGIQENAAFTSLSVMDKVALMSDSLCEDLAKYHLSADNFLQMNVNGPASCSTLILGRSISVSTFVDGPYSGLTSLNSSSAILKGGGDIEASNGYLNKCSKMIPRSDRLLDDQMKHDGDMNIFCQALQLTGFDKVIQQEKKDAVYELASQKPTDRDGNVLYCPSECKVRWTVFAETDKVMNANGIYNIDDLIKFANEKYGNCSGWYTYLAEKGITVSQGNDYTNTFNALNMFVAYHILRAGMRPDKICYEQNYTTKTWWNICFGYDAQEYFETMLPNTLMKIWCLNPHEKGSKELRINRYRQNNTLSDEYGTLGSDATHPILFDGLLIDRNNFTEGLNGYINRIDGMLVYDQYAVDAQKERLRLDSSTFLYETINNGIRLATSSEISVMNGGGNGNRVAFDNKYFDNIVCYNPNTLLRYNVMGGWRANNNDQFQGWAAYDFAVKLPHVPTGTYEVRIVYPPMGRGGLMQYYIGSSSKQEDMKALGIPFNAYEDPTLEGNSMAYESIKSADTDENTDYGITAGRNMKVRGYMYGPASFSRGLDKPVGQRADGKKLVYDPLDIYSAAKEHVGGSSSRSETAYGNMILRHIIGTVQIKQSEDVWIRIKNLISTDPDLGWSLDFIELCPVSIANNTEMPEDWY